MSGKSWLTEQIEEDRKDPEFVAGLLALELNEDVVNRMEAQKLNRSDLAKKMAVSKAYITKLLQGHPNMTLKTIAALAVALNAEASITLKPKSRDREWIQAFHAPIGGYIPITVKARAKDSQVGNSLAIAA